MEPFRAPHHQQHARHTCSGHLQPGIWPQARQTEGAARTDGNLRLRSFDVLVGRTAHEVIQVRSILYPFAVHVVRTITLMRSSNGYVFRSDSGWKAESDGFYDFSYAVNL